MTGAPFRWPWNATWAVAVAKDGVNAPLAARPGKASSPLPSCLTILME